MNVMLTQNPKDRGPAPAYQKNQGDCDCVCACPIAGLETLSSAAALSLPAAYYLELTPHCPNHCPGCGNVYAQTRATLAPPLDEAAWCALITRLANHAQHFKITGGEPTWHPDFAAILCTINDLGIPFSLFTTGRWTDPAATLALLRSLPTCEGMLISLHGPDAATHDAFTATPGSFADTIVNIRRATTAAGLSVALSFVINAHNWNKIVAMLPLAKALGANHVVCNRFIGADIPGITPNTIQLQAAIATIETLQSAGQPIRFGNCIPQCFAASSATGCTAGSTFATLDPWGHMRPCNHVPTIVGDTSTHTIADLWHGPVMQNWRARVPVDCTTCAAFAQCHGGCPAQALLTGQMRDPLIQKPLAAAVSTAWAQKAPVHLYAALRPQGHFTQRPRDAHMLLYHGYAIPIPTFAAGLATRLNGTFTLGEIATHYGQDALNWVGELHTQGFVTWDG